VTSLNLNIGDNGFTKITQLVISIIGAFVEFKIYRRHHFTSLHFTKISQLVGFLGDLYIINIGITKK